MSNEHNFLITYGLHNFVTHAESDGKHIFTIHGIESQKLISHAKSLRRRHSSGLTLTQP
jgi:hypothetical protein